MTEHHCQACQDLYSLQFIPCIWGKFLRHGIRLQEAAAQGVHKLRHVHNVLKCSDRRRDKERILQMEGVVLSEMLRQCDKRGLGQKLLEYSPAVVGRVAERISWNEEPSASTIVAMLAVEQIAATDALADFGEETFAATCADNARRISDVIRNQKRTPVLRRDDYYKPFRIITSHFWLITSHYYKPFLVIEMTLR